MAWPRRLLLILSGFLLFLLLVAILPENGPGIKQTPVKQHRRPRYKPESDDAFELVEDNFPLAASANKSTDLPHVPAWNKPRHVTENTPLFIGFTRNWVILQQAVVSYITAGWPPEDIYVVENTGTMQSNKLGLLTLQNPFYLDYHRLTKILGVNVITTPTLFSFAQLQNFFLHTALENDWKHYFWSHQDVLALPDESARPYISLYHRAVEILKESKRPTYPKWGCRWFSYDRLTLVNVAAFMEVGGWDTMIPFYGTDCDMHERLMMAGYKMFDAFIGYIFDVGTTLPDLRMLYREKDHTSSLCEDGTSGIASEYGPGDCRYMALNRTATEMCALKNIDKGGRNFWQLQQHGGQGEPFYRDPDGFEKAMEMTINSGRAIMTEKWGHKGCRLRGSGLRTADAWRVEHDWDEIPKKSGWTWWR